MALLKAEADKLTTDDVVAGVIEEIITVDEMWHLLPFTKTQGKAYVYVRENALPTVDFLDPNDAVSEDAATFSEVTTNLRIIAGDVDVDKFIEATESNINPQKAVQIVAKAKAMTRKFQDTLVNGDSGANAKSFDGMAKLVTGPQTIAAGANGAALTLSMLDDLVDLVLTGASCIVMRRGTYRAYLSLLRALGGTQPHMVMIPNFGMVPSHNGVPIIRNDWLPATEVQGTSGATTCSVYAVRFDEADGLHGIYGGPNAGWVIEDIGTVQNKDATRTRVKWYTGLALKSTKSVARLTGVTNV